VPSITHDFDNDVIERFTHIETNSATLFSDRKPTLALIFNEKNTIPMTDTTCCRLYSLSPRQLELQAGALRRDIILFVVA